MKRVVSGGQYCCWQVAKAIRSGVLTAPRLFACVDCGGQAIEYDHRDYNEPLKVDPVCRSCNLRRGPAIPRRWDRAELLDTLRRRCTGPHWRISPRAREWCVRQIKHRCRAIEKLTSGVVSAHELRPDLFEAKAA